MAPCSLNCVGIIGVGKLGSAIAHRLVEAGFEIIAYDTNPVAAALIEEEGGRVATPFEIAHLCRRIVVALPSHDLVSTALSTLQPTTVVIDVTKATPEQSQETAAALRARGIGYLDAPVCDWYETVRERGGKVLCGGEPSAVSACRDIFAAFAHPLVYAGPSGAGTQMRIELEKEKEKS